MNEIEFQEAFHYEIHQSTDSQYFIFMQHVPIN